MCERRRSAVWARLAKLLLFFFVFQLCGPVGFRPGAAEAEIADGVITPDANAVDLTDVDSYVNNGGRDATEAITVSGTGDQSGGVTLPSVSFLQSNAGFNTRSTIQSYDHDLAGDSGGGIDAAGKTLTFSGALTGTGGMLRLLAGNFVVGGSGNDYDGGTYLRGGSLLIAAGDSLGTGPVTLQAPATFGLNPAVTAVSLDVPVLYVRRHDNRGGTKTIEIPLSDDAVLRLPRIVQAENIGGGSHDVALSVIGKGTLSLAGGVSKIELNPDPGQTVRLVAGGAVSFDAVTLGGTGTSSLAAVGQTGVFGLVTVSNANHRLQINDGGEWGQVVWDGYDLDFAAGRLANPIAVRNGWLTLRGASTVKSHDFALSADAALEIGPGVRDMHKTRLFFEDGATLYLTPASANVGVTLEAARNLPAALSLDELARTAGGPVVNGLNLNLDLDAISGDLPVNSTRWVKAAAVASMDVAARGLGFRGEVGWDMEVHAEPGALYMRIVTTDNQGPGPGPGGPSGPSEQRPTLRIVPSSVDLVIGERAEGLVLSLDVQPRSFSIERIQSFVISPDGSGLELTHIEEPEDHLLLSGVPASADRYDVIVNAYSGAYALRASADLTVLPVGVTVSPALLTLEVGEAARASAQVRPEWAADRSVSWSVSDPAVASVEPGGGDGCLVTALSHGTAVVTAAAKADPRARASLRVTVTSDDVEPPAGGSGGGGGCDAGAGLALGLTGLMALPLLGGRRRR